MGSESPAIRMRIAAVVLAAGASSRLGEPKQLLTDERGETLVHRATREAVEAELSPVMVVVGALASLVGVAVEDLVIAAGSVHVVENKAWETGLSSSIRCGVQAVLEFDDSINALLIVTCDMPSVGTEHLRTLRRVFADSGTRVASGYGGTVGIPAIIPRAEFEVLMLLDGDRGAKQLLIQHDTTTVSLEGGSLDLDTPDDVARWRAQDATR